LSPPIRISLAVEDDLTDELVRNIIRQASLNVEVGDRYMARGFGNLRAKIKGFNKIAQRSPVVLVTDLDRCECAPILISDWLGTTPRHPSLLFRVAVKEVETWVLADGWNFARYLGISESLVPRDVEALEDPKACLINLAKRCRSRVIREDIVPHAKSKALKGPAYNSRLIQFICQRWNLREAQKSSDSLKRAVVALERLCAQRA
jgi:hypothetical protein